MSKFSDAVKADLAAIETAVSTVVTDAENTVETIVEDLGQVATDLFAKAPAVLVQVVVSSVKAAFAAGGSAATMFDAAETAGLNTLVALGRPLLDSEVVLFKTLIGTQMAAPAV